MIRIRTVKELRTAWKTLVSALYRDLGAVSRLSTDPTGTLRELGYELEPEARAALLAAMP